MLKTAAIGTGPTARKAIRTFFFAKETHTNMRVEVGHYAPKRTRRGHSLTLPQNPAGQYLHPNTIKGRLQGLGAKLHGV